MRRTAVAAGTDLAAREAAQAYLQGGGDAVGAVVSGFFAAAGTYPGVLLGPLGLLIARVGVGVRAFDGRQRQPGLGVRRPRGLSADDAIPLAARAAAPSGIAALLVALRYGPNVSLAKVTAAGINAAKRAGCARRAEVLDHIQRLGAAALAAPAISRPLLHAAGPVEGGSLSAGDLEFIPELDHPAHIEGLRRTAPWAAQRLAPDQEEQGSWQAQSARQQVLCACDLGGGVAVLCYDDAPSGLDIPELELTLPLHAVPPRRGAQRLAPGRFIPAPAPMFIETAAGDVASAAGAELGERGTVAVRAIE